SGRGSTRNCSRGDAWSALADSFRGLARSTTRRKSLDGASCRSPVRISYVASTRRVPCPLVPLGHSPASLNRTEVDAAAPLVLATHTRVCCSPYLGCPAHTLVAM